MPAPLSVALEVMGIVVALAAVGLTVWAWVERPFRVSARAGVVGRERRSWVYRDSAGLAVVRGARRHRLPLEPASDQAARRVVTARGVELTAYVFRGSDHLVHTVAFTDASDRTARLVSSRPRRLQWIEAMPRYAAILALGVAISVPWLLAWSTGSMLPSEVVRVSAGPTLGCDVTWTSPDGAFHRDGVLCPAGDVVGDVVEVHALGWPFEDTAQAPVDAYEDLAFLSVVAAVSTVGFVLVVGRAVLSVRRKAIVLRPVASGPERRVAAQLPLYDLALAVQRVEAHGDLEDNDELRSWVRALWRTTWRPILTCAVVVVAGGAYAAAVAVSLVWGLAVGTVLLVGASVWLARQVRSRSAAGVAEDAWTRWPQAVSWRRARGRVSVVLFDAGEAVWTIPVDRVFAPGARLDVTGTLRVGSVPVLRANGITLFTTGPAEQVTSRTADVMRQELVEVLLRSRPAVQAPLP